ncbi:hypothetical protein COO60DRAFT_1642879 [Scenedesmus sp. NREL 46B-D3]|nr:hypothetical protein COO60DRAFT_1642879 [Scenedesmus sp. NREL 46B-D3]
MSLLRLSKLDVPSGRGAPNQAQDDPAAELREKKSGVFGTSKNKSKRKMRTPEPSNTELAKLLGNRTRALLAFEEPGFEPGAFMAAYLGQLGEKAISNARRDLGALLATCTEEVESVVQQHHQRFLQACAGVEALEDQVALLRNYTNGLTALVASLKSALSIKPDRPHAGRGSAAAHTQAGLLPSSPVAASCAMIPDDDEAGSPLQQIEADMELMLQELDLATAVRDLPAAVSWLRTAEGLATLLDRDAAVLVLEVADFPGWRHSYDAAVGLRKQRLVAALQRQLSDANASAVEIRAASHALIDLVGDASALAAMLHCHSHKVGRSQALLLKQHAAGSDPDSLEFAGGLMQRTLLEVAAAADDLVAIFGVGQREPTSVFTVWAARQARGAANILLRHVLSAAAAASTGLHTTVQVVAMCMVLCAMLEDSHAISLSSTLMSELWPCVDGSLRRHLKRFGEELRMAATEEVNSLVLAALAAGGTSAVQRGPKLGATFKKALTDIFCAATQTIGFTLRSHLESASPEAAAGLAPLLPGIMEVLAGLTEDALPAAAAPLAAAAGPVLDVRAMDRALQALYRECSKGSRGARGSPAKGGGLVQARLLQQAPTLAVESILRFRG